MTGADLLVCLFALLTSNSKTNFNQFCRLGGSSVRHLSYPGHGPVTTVSWSPSGQLLVSGSPADSNLMVGFTVFLYLSQWLWRGLLAWQIDNRGNDSCRFDGIDSNRQHFLPTLNSPPEVKIREITIHEPSSFLKHGHKLQSIRSNRVKSTTFSTHPQSSDQL